MSIDRTTITKLTSAENYRRGQDIFLIDTRIQNFEMNIHPLSGLCNVTASVSDANGNTHDVNIIIDEDNNKIFESKCSCPDFFNSGKLCAHCVAVLLKYISRRSIMSTSHFSKRTQLRPFDNSAANHVIESYIKQYSVTQENESLAGSVEIEPILHRELHRFSVEFKIGTKKKYIIKDLIELAHAMRDRTFLEYGKNLKFFHERQAFSKESQPILDFILRYVHAYEYYYHHIQNDVYTFHPMKALRYLPLSPEAMDDFFDTMMNRSVKFFMNDQVIASKIVDGNPYLEFSLEQMNYTKFKLICCPCETLAGEHNFFVFKEDTFYRCTPGFVQNMRLFLHQLKILKSNVLLLSKEQMIPFCGNVLTMMEPYIALETKLDLSEYMPPETHFSIYLDYPRNDTVSCRAYAHYNDEEILLTTPITVNSGYRDTLHETSVLSDIYAYFKRNEDKTIDADFIIDNDEGQIFLFLEQGLPHFHQLGEVFISNEMKKLRIIDAPKASIGVSVAGNLLELDIQSSGLPYDELAGILNSYRRRKKFYKLKSGEYVRLENNSFSILSELADGLNLSEKDIENGKISVPLYRSAYVDAVLSDHNGDIKSHRDHYFKSLIRDLQSVENSDYEVPDHLKPILRDYQKTGYRWMMTLTDLHFGGILADDMGLGKTLQVITLLSTAQKSEEPSLIICPSSLVYNWESEIERFAPTLKTLIVTGNAAERQEKLMHCEGFNILITSYDMLKRDIEHYEPIHFNYQIIDEAQVIKNHRTQAARSVCQIHSKTRFALTGTPIENRLSELWSIFQYIMPGFLYSYLHFRTELEQPIIEDKDVIASNRLQQLVKPFIMRRLKKDVLKELPDKLENAVYAQMGDEQYKLYEASALELQRGLKAQTNEHIKRNKIQILAELTKLRQLCCDPSLVYDNYKSGSAKLETCIQLITEAISGGHKILLFSQFTSMLDIIEKRLDSEKITYYRLDGSTKSEERIRLVSSFNENQVPVFLISLKAGGTGLNLTGADIVIHYDPWWNAAAENQATDRAHRIGQIKTVTVYKLIAKHTIEEKILELQETKKALADEIIGQEGITKTALTKEDLLDMLKL